MCDSFALIGHFSNTIKISTSLSARRVLNRTGPTAMTPHQKRSRNTCCGMAWACLVILLKDHVKPIYIYIYTNIRFCSTLLKKVVTSTDVGTSRIASVEL